MLNVVGVTGLLWILYYIWVDGYTVFAVECLYRDKPIHWNRFKINCTSMSSGPESDERRDLFVEYVVYLYHKYNCRGSVVGWAMQGRGCECQWRGGGGGKIII